MFSKWPSIDFESLIVARYRDYGVAVEWLFRANVGVLEYLFGHYCSMAETAQVMKCGGWEGDEVGEEVRVLATFRTLRYMSGISRTI